MILFPQKYRVYWYVTDFWEKFYAVPVQVERINGIYNSKAKPLTIRFDFVGNTDHVYDVSRRELYRTEKQARRVSAKLNKAMGRVLQLQR